MVKVDNSHELYELQVDDRCKDSVVVDKDVVEPIWWDSVSTVDLARRYWWSNGVVGVGG